MVHKRGVSNMERLDNATRHEYLEEDCPWSVGASDVAITG
jgi:hypothetical protein